MTCKDTENHISEIGMNNKQCIQAFKKSYGDKQSTYRLVLYSYDLTKRMGGKNHMYTMSNKLPFKLNYKDKNDLGKVPLEDGDTIPHF
jgi:hypothetical protein